MEHGSTTRILNLKDRLLSEQQPVEVIQNNRKFNRNLEKDKAVNSELYMALLDRLSAENMAPYAKE